MKRRGPPSEIRRLAAPLAHVVDGAWRRMHWWIATMAALYALSGITIVKPEEVAMVLRWGRLVGDTPALQQHGAGLLFAFPRPIDEVIRVQTKRVTQIQVATLDAGGGIGATDDDEAPASAGNSLDPVLQGYAVTGDQNIVQVSMVAHYRIRDPGTWKFYAANAEDVLRTEVTAAMVRSIGEMGVDRVLSDGRKDLIATAGRRTQAGLDAAHSGLELTSLEVTRLGPPAALVLDFSRVQSAFIEAETKKKEAQAYAETAVPRATADVDAALQAARASAASDLAVAKGEAAAFLALDREYRLNPVVVRERLYRDGVERAIGASSVRWLPPPIGGNYHGMRITVGPPGSTGKAVQAGEPERP